MSNIAGFLGIARKAGKLSMGFDVSAENINLGNAFLVLIAKDCSERTSAEIIKICNKNNVRFLGLPLTMDEIDYTLGKRSGVMAVCDKNFAEKINTMLLSV